MQLVYIHDDWPGVKFDYAPRMWALGVTGEQIRDVIQKELCGELEGSELTGTGAIPRKCIIQESVIRSPQTKGLVKDFKVIHKCGNDTSISFKAYSQGQHVLMGAGIELHLD